MTAFEKASAALLAVDQIMREATVPPLVLDKWQKGVLTLTGGNSGRRRVRRAFLLGMVLYNLHREPENHKHLLNIN